MNGWQKQFFLGVLILLTAGQAFAAKSAGHEVTVNVVPINRVVISGGDVALTIDRYAGNGKIQSLPFRQDGLIWETNQEGRTITVSTDLSDPAYVLTVEAASISGDSGAISTGPVAVQTEAQELIHDITEGSGQCALIFTADAELDSGDHTETQTLTYTITGR